MEIIEVRKGAERKHSIEVLARNLQLDIKCEDCGNPASCMTWEDNYPYYYCDKCIVDNEDYFGSISIANSPRMGMCGYSGPAEEYINITKWNG